VNLDGEVVGINTLINMGPGGAYGFAIPINHAQRVAKVLMSDGKIRHAFLGIYLDNVKDGKKQNDGEPDANEQPIKNSPPRAAYVTRVTQSSPAAKAGMHVGDVITQIDGQKIEGANAIIDYVSSHQVGDKVTVHYLRDGNPGTVSITLGELMADNGREQPQLGEDRIGLSMQTLTPEVARLLGVDPSSKGAVVTEVIPASRAAKAGLRAEDVIVEVDRKPVASVQETSAALKENPKAGHLLKIRRGGAASYITIPAQ
jgi:serine protease Do